MIQCLSTKTTQVHPAAFWRQGRHPEWRLGPCFPRRPDCRQPSSRREAVSGRSPVRVPSVWSIARPSSVNLTATRTCSTAERARSSPERIRVTARAAGISRVLGICRIPSCLDNGVVRPAPVLRAMMERVGFGPGDHIVTHCEGGGRAALAAAAAVRAGYDDVRVYYLSFADWARDESCPIVRD